MHADDSTIYTPESTTEDLSSALNKELQFVVEWVTNNKLVLNVSKTKSTVFGSKHLLMNEPKLKLYVKDMAVEQVQETKLLGIIVDSKLLWSKHIENVVSKMGRGLSVMRRCSYVLPSNAMGNNVMAIKTLVLSHQRFGQVLPCHMQRSCKLLRIRKHVVYYVLQTELMSMRCITVYRG